MSAVPYAAGGAALAFAMPPLSPWMAAHTQWIGFHVALLLLLAAELGLSNLGRRGLDEQAKVRRQRQNAAWATAVWTLAALLFAVYVWRAYDATSATQFLAGYAVEESLSIDNLFVFLLLFRLFKVPPASQPRVLFWGVAGAILMRGAFIAAGIELLERSRWVGYLFGLMLLIAAVRLVLPSKESEQEEGEFPSWMRFVLRLQPVSARTDVFFARENGRGMVSMLFLALLTIELSDVVFALDSIPAVLSITRDPFLAYTSNILAVMGLRSLFFLLAEALKRLRYLHFGLAAVLALAALKMLLAAYIEVGPVASLLAIVAILGITVVASLAAKREV